MSKFLSPLQERLFLKLYRAGLTKITQRDARVIQRAFVEALKEEVEERYRVVDHLIDPRLEATFNRPLVIAGLGSFKMRTRPQRTFGTIPGLTQPTKKPPACRLVFTAKWEEIK